MQTCFVYKWRRLLANNSKIFVEFIKDKIITSLPIFNFRCNLNFNY